MYILFKLLFILMHLPGYFPLTIHLVELTKKSKENGLRNPNTLCDEFARTLQRRYRGRIAA